MQLVIIGNEDDVELNFPLSPRTNHGLKKRTLHAFQAVLLKSITLTISFLNEVTSKSCSHHALCLFADLMTSVTSLFFGFCSDFIF